MSDSREKVKTIFGNGRPASSSQWNRYALEFDAVTVDVVGAVRQQME